MKTSDYVIVSINNNGSAFIVTETGSFETSREEGESTIYWARNFYKEVASKRYDNGDWQFWFN